MATVKMLDSDAHNALQPSEDSDAFRSGSSDLTDTSTPSSTPPSMTHDTSRARFHMKDLGCFATSLENSAKRAFPTRGRSCSRYKSAQALLLMWQDDELGVDNELDGLHQIFGSYGFDTETWLIPSDNPHLELMIKAANFVKKYESEDCLLIVYYGGHAAINSARQSSWYWKEDPEFASISLEWSAIQTVFEKATSDVLLLLDCCFAASAAPIAGRAITETIAACGWETIAPAPGRWSFTSALIEVLDEWIDHSFSVAMLHSRVLSVLKHEQPERRGQKKRKVECRRTPVYISTSAEPGTPSINFSRLRSKESTDNKSKVGVQAASDGQVSSDVENAQNMPDAYGLDSLTSSDPIGNLKVPHVLITLALCENQELELKACSEWLAAFPALAKYVKVKGVYRSHSTLIIASVPVVLWDLLPENRACSFIGYVTSDNLLEYRETSNAPSAAYSQVLDAYDDSKAGNHADLKTLISQPASDVPSSEPLFSTTSILQRSWSSYGLSDPLVRSLDPPPIEIKSQLFGMGGHSPRLNLTPRSRESTEEKEDRTGLNPERRIFISDLQLPNLKEQEEAQRFRAINMVVEGWRSQVQDSIDGVPEQSSSTWSAPLGYCQPAIFNEIARSKKDPTEENDIEPVSDTWSVRENQVKDGQVYFNPEATGINAKDRALMKESRLWIDGPVYPYMTETKIQAQSANDTARRWNETADTYSIISRTATWGTRRRSEPGISDIESIHNGNFLRRILFKTDKEFKIDREKRAHSLIDSITKIVRKKSNSDKPKRKYSATEILSRPEARPFTMPKGRDNLAPPSSELISVQGRAAPFPLTYTNLDSPPISGLNHSGINSVSATASPPKKTSRFNLGAMRRHARERNNSHHDSSGEGMYEMWKQTGGPPVAKLGAPSPDSDLSPSVSPRSFSNSTAPTSYSREDNEGYDMNNISTRDSEPIANPQVVIEEFGLRLDKKRPQK